MTPLLDLITSSDPAVRNLPLEALCRQRSTPELLDQCRVLDRFRRESPNLYHRVRALFFLSAIHRYHLLPLTAGGPVGRGKIPFAGFQHQLRRRFSEAIDVFLAEQERDGPSTGLSSALAEAYRALAFQTLADQVRHSVRTVRGNQWMFRIGHPNDHPLRFRPELLRRDQPGSPYPILSERTPVRMDLSHSAWSDIFFLGMDFPEGARVLNISVDLGVRGRDREPRPPIETYLRVLDEPILRLVSVDLDAQATLTSVDEVFDFARDYLGLLKAAVIASGLVPPGTEGCGQSLAELLARVIGPGLGLEIVSQVNDIPKGSRLAVSTNLLGSLISICMRATGQVQALSGGLSEADRRIVAARAILGEWLGGSGGGWQDSGGVWPGIKLITGVAAGEQDPEFSISRGRLLPQHQVFGDNEVPAATRDALARSLVLVHGGMAQNVGPILEMVTEKYLLRGEAEWQGRLRAMQILDEVTSALRKGDIQAIGTATTANFNGPLQAIIPWCTNRYTESLIEQTRDRFGSRFWGFWMLGGMAGGGMGFIFDPGVQETAKDWLQETMTGTKTDLQHALPFAMDPVVYDFAINDRGSWGQLLVEQDAAMPGRYYALVAPQWLRTDVRTLSPMTRQDLERFGKTCLEGTSTEPTVRGMLRRMLPHTSTGSAGGPSLEALLAEFGFDREQHEMTREELRAGRIGLAQNRLRPDVLIEDVTAEDVIETQGGLDSRLTQVGQEAIAAGQVAVISLAAGAGSRWTAGAGVVKALHPFCKFNGRHRSFVEVHLAKSRSVSRRHGTPLPHVLTTSYLTHEPLAHYLAATKNGGYPGPLLLSPGRSVGLRMIPMVRDLRFAWEEMPQQVLDERQQKVRASLRSALVQWAVQAGEGSDYIDNLPLQCLHPVGHWYEVPNLLRNGVLERLLQERPQLTYLLLHNVDTLGANVDPALLGLHIEREDCLSFEVLRRRLDDRGGGLARVNGKVRILEGLAMPREEDDFRLSYYNSMTTWIHLDKLLAVFGLTREALGDRRAVDAAVRRLGQRIPTYTTLKDVKKRWGHGQEDVFPVSQFEKLWSDMTALPEVRCGYFAVSLARGQQLKDPGQLDGWLRDGSAAQMASLCEWG